MENQELIKQVTEKAEKWLTPAYDAETQAAWHIPARILSDIRDASLRQVVQ